MKKNNELDLNQDENMLLMIYFHQDRDGTIQSLRNIQSQLTPEERELKDMTDSLIGKLSGISDTDFLQLEVVRDYLS
ncbi:MAG: transposon-transfer assisting family protein [Lachnospiraceae bacterium]|nr:transposon-transfer assisting family protein [Lachnospiraceae bacterium]